MSKALVRILNSGFVVHPSREMIHTFKGYLKRMYRYETPPANAKSFKLDRRQTLKEKWCIEVEALNEYRINICYLKEFRNYFANYDIEYILETPILGDKVAIDMKSFFTPRGPQIGYKEFLVNSDGITPHLTLPAQPGTGKTVTFLAVAAAYGRRVAAIIPPFLSDRWALEIEKFTNLTSRDYAYISGGKVLKSYMTTIEQGRNPFKIVLFSVNTLRNYYRDYYDNPDEWIYSPEDFFRAAGFGLRGIDEAHKELHFHFITTLFLNTSKYVALSGTITKEDEFLNDMATRLFPLEGRCPVDEVVASTDAAIYKLYFSGWIPKHKSSMGYSHVLFENDIRYHPSINEMYFNYIARVVYMEFVRYRRNKTDKVLIFMATVRMADAFRDYLENSPIVGKYFVDQDIGRLRAGEPDEKCDDLNIVVTTVGRCGTGTDIPGVLTIVNTIAISDGNLQRQVLGRGRERKDGNCRYVRIYSPHIQKHNDYHIKSMRVLQDLCEDIKILELPGSIPSPTGYDREEARKTENHERSIRQKKKKKTEKAASKRKSRKRLW